MMQYVQGIIWLSTHNLRNRRNPEPGKSLFRGVDCPVILGGKFCTTLVSTH